MLLSDGRPAGDKIRLVYLAGGATAYNKVLPAPLTSFAPTYMARGVRGLGTKCSVFSISPVWTERWWATSATQERWAPLGYLLFSVTN